MLGTARITTPAQWMGVASRLTMALSSADMTTRTDLIVQVVDGPMAKNLPIAWHIPATSDVALNATKIDGFQSLRDLTAYELERYCRQYITSSSVSYDPDDFTDKDDPNTVFMRIRGVLCHEAAHSKWSHYLLEPWYSELTEEQAEVITMLDEVRIEGLQADYSDDFRTAMRVSSRMLLPSREDIDQMRVDAKRIDLFKFSLNVVLSLGRRDQGMLLEYEVRELRNFAEDVLGRQRLRDMRALWNDFAEIDDHGDGTAMTAIADEWIELFKTDDDDMETLDLLGLIDLLSGLFDRIGEGAERWASNKKNTHSPDLPADPATEAKKVFRRTKTCTNPDCPCKKDKDAKDDPSHGYSASGGGKWKTRKVTAEERAASAAFAKRLERLSVRARSEVKIRSVSPPGRLKSRAAVAQAAARSQGRASTAEPWARTKRMHNDSPPLTVGMITDVSGSMRWAEQLVASSLWVITRAVRHVNGTTAAAVFGYKAEPVLGPSDRLEDIIKVREATDGMEEFNDACAAVVGQLGLLDRNKGARILFVISDGLLVGDGQMSATAKWVDKLTRSGCKVIWMNKDAPPTPAARKARQYRGYPILPNGAHYVQVERADVATINRIADEVAKALTTTR